MSGDKSRQETARRTGAPTAAASAIVPQPPHLATLNDKPSWVNRAGRIDRSGCLEVRASELWRDASFTCARTFSGREAVAHVTVTARRLAQLHDSRSPRELSGDSRTRKSNVMKSRTTPTDRPSMPAGNPNKGASRTKRLALWSGAELTYEHLGEWSQQIRIEKWRRGPRKKHHARHSGESHLPEAPMPPSSQHFLICPTCDEKFLKLFLVLAHEQEVCDAELAEGWVRGAEARIAASRRPAPAEFLRFRARLIARYGQLFRRHRILRCRECLGMRYGEVRTEQRAKHAAAETGDHHARDARRVQPYLSTRPH